MTDFDTVITDEQLANGLIPVPSGKKSKKSAAKSVRKSKRLAAKKSKKINKKAKKAKKSRRKLSKKQKHIKNLKKGAANRHHKTVAQIVLLAVNSYAHDVTFAQIRNLIKASGVKVSSFVLKSVIKTMVKNKILRHPKGGKKGNRYESTGKKLSGKSVMRRKRLSAKMAKTDKKFRAAMKRIAHKKNRNGRTFEVVIFEYMSLKEGNRKKKLTFNQISAYLKKNNMKLSNFVLKKVLDRLRAKQVMKLEKAHNVVTGKKMPAKRR